MDREQVYELVGRKVAVKLVGAGGRGVGVLATLDEAREDGVVLSDIGDLGLETTIFCPWDSFQWVRELSYWPGPPHEEPGPEEGSPDGESSKGGGVPAEGTGPPTDRREPSAWTLERVLPVAQKRTVDGITVALTSLELFGRGLGVLRWRVSFGEDVAFGGYGFGIPEPQFDIRAGGDRDLPWSPRGAGASGEEADGEIEVEGLPETGEIEVVVPRLVADAHRRGEYHGEGPSYAGPWTFRFSL